MWTMVVGRGMDIVFLSLYANLYSHNHAILAEILLQFHFKGPIKRTSTKGDSWRSSSLESLAEKAAARASLFTSTSNWTIYRRLLLPNAELDR